MWKSATQSVEEKENRRIKENTGDEKVFTTSLWRAKHTIFLMPTQLLHPQLRLLFFRKAIIWKAGMRRKIGGGGIKIRVSPGNHNYKSFEELL